MKTKVRFNLGRGKNFMKWKIESEKGIVYLEPSEVNLVMTNASLRNRKKTAQGIKNGANKSVCSWILCDEVTFTTEKHEGEQIRYNPRVNPFWMNADGDNIDGTTYEVLFTNNRNIYR